MSDKSPRAVTTAMLAKYFDQFGDVIVKTLKKTVDEDRARIAALEARVLELEAQRAARARAPLADISDLVP